LLAGGQIGINYQTGPWVFGVEGQLSWADLQNKSTQVFTTVSSADFRSRVEYLGPVTARLGYTIQPTVLLYLKGGVAFDNSKLDAALIIADQTAETATLQQDRIGWTIGGGVESTLDDLRRSRPFSSEIGAAIMVFVIALRAWDHLRTVASG
jgi:outer membrane immunogenic protein